MWVVIGQAGFSTVCITVEGDNETIARVNAINRIKATYPSNTDFYISSIKEVGK